MSVWDLDGRRADGRRALGTGLMQAWAAMSLQQPPRRAGFASGCQAFGHRELFGVLRQFGLVLDPVVTGHR